MIYPRLNRVRNGQRLSVELVNGLIKRTEYAGDLLSQYRPLAGDNITTANQFDGVTINALDVGLFSGLPRDADGVILIPPDGKTYELPEPPKLPNGGFGPAEYIFKAAPGSSGTVILTGGNYTVFRPAPLGPFLSPASQFIPFLLDRVVSFSGTSGSGADFFLWGMGLGSFNEFFPVVGGSLRYIE